MANSVDPDQQFDVGLHCLIRYMCRKIKDMYDTYPK